MTWLQKVEVWPQTDRRAGWSVDPPGVVVDITFAGVAGVFAAWAWRRQRERRRGELGLCVCCGYNLTGLTERRCPECGAIVERAASEKTGE